MYSNVEFELGDQPYYYYFCRKYFLANCRFNMIITWGKNKIIVRKLEKKGEGKGKRKIKERKEEKGKTEEKKEKEEEEEKLGVDPGGSSDESFELEQEIKSHQW